jgi:hypothetical protein
LTVPLNVAEEDATEEAALVTTVGVEALVVNVPEAELNEVEFAVVRVIDRRYSYVVLPVSPVRLRDMLLVV